MENDLYIKLKVDTRALNKAMKILGNALQFLSVQCKKQERERMRELVYKYGHIREYLESPVQIEKIVDHNGDVVDFMMKDTSWSKLDEDEKNAFNDWIKVLEGYNPNWSWKMIADYQKERRKEATLKKYNAITGAFLG